MNARWLVVLAAALSGCIQVRYVGQAAFGQLELISAARPITEVLQDPSTDERTRVLLAEVDRVTEFARAQGLSPQGNYRRYVELDGRAVVWMVTASAPLAFIPKTWWFPIVGAFPYLGWFEEREARRYAARLESAGWDVAVRRVSAFSTGGWFKDPVVSTMLSERDDALRSLANVLLHELVHANILIPNQAVFNESLASFVADAMTADYLAQRFGATSRELEAYRVEIEARRELGAELAAGYRRLESLYASERPEPDKRRRKQALITRLTAELRLRAPPNNATLIGFKTYNAGFDAFARLEAACDSWPQFLAAIESLDESAFSQEQQEELGAVLEPLIESDCAASTARWQRSEARRG